MGILDFLKKKSPKVAENGALALDELPPIPADQEPQPTSAPPQDMPPLDPVPSQNSSSDLTDMPALPAQADLAAPPQSESPSSIDEGLAVPSDPPVNNEVFEQLNADLAAANETTPSPSKEESQDDIPPQPNYADEVPTKEEIEEVLLADKKNQEELPGFEEESQVSEDELSESDSWSSQNEPIPVKTESLLLKSIFVEREHYANLLFSLRVVKDDLEKSAPQQRKLSNIDMKLGKQYSKLSTVYENFNENIMMIEHIISNEKF